MMHLTLKRLKAPGNLGSVVVGVGGGFGGVEIASWIQCMEEDVEELESVLGGELNLDCTIDQSINQ